jgi:hypothetical protein
VGLLHCQGCNKLVSNTLAKCPHCDLPILFTGPKGWKFWEEWLLMAHVFFGISLLGFGITAAVGSAVLADFFGRLSLLALLTLLAGKVCQCLWFRRRR